MTRRSRTRGPATTRSRADGVTQPGSERARATGSEDPLLRPRPHPAPAVLPAQPRPDRARHGASQPARPRSISPTRSCRASPHDQKLKQQRPEVAGAHVPRAQSRDGRDDDAAGRPAAPGAASSWRSTPRRRRCSTGLKDLTRPPRACRSRRAVKVKVVVVDGSGVTGRARNVLDAFTAAGFQSGGLAADADRSRLREDPGSLRARQVRRRASPSRCTSARRTSWRPRARRCRSATRTLGGDVIVVVGRDYPTLRGLAVASAAARRRPPRRRRRRRARRAARRRTTTHHDDRRPRPTPASSRRPKGTTPLVGCPHSAGGVRRAGGLGEGAPELHVASVGW